MTGTTRTLTTVAAMVASMVVILPATPATAVVPGTNGKIAFSSNGGDIYVMDPDGSGRTNLTNTASYDDDPAWSPDGTKIAFSSEQGGSEAGVQYEVYAMNADGSGQTNLTNALGNDQSNDSAPAWSPGGTKIAFASDRDGNDEIYLMNADGSAQTNLTNNPAADSTPAWSPDGTKIAFTRSGDIHVMNADGSGASNLTNNPAADSTPAWSPDGTKIAFGSMRDGNPEIYVMNTDGSAQTNLTNSPWVEGGPDWAADSSPDPSAADLSLTMTASDSRARVGSEVTFTVTTSNRGPANATGVEVTDQLPAGLTFVSAAASQGGYTASTGVWTVGELAAGSAATLRLVAKPAVTELLTNTAEVTAADQSDSDSVVANHDPREDDQATVSVDARQADLSLTMSVSDTAPAAGSDVTFTLTVANAGSSAATGVEVTDQLPAGLTYKSSTYQTGYGYNPSNGVWKLSDLANGGAQTLKIVATTSTTEQLTNTAEITAADKLDPNSTPGNHAADEDDQASVTLNGSTPPPAPEADLSLTLTASNTTPALGSQVTYTITVSNAGPAAAGGVAVGGNGPWWGSNLVSATPSQGSHDSASGLWTVGTIPAGASATSQLVVEAADAGTNTYYATVNTSDVADPDSTPGNYNPSEDDQDSVTITATPNCPTAKVNAAADSWVGQNTASTNYGTSTTVNVRSKSSANRRALVRFNLPAIPAGCKVTGAQLRLYASTSTAGRTLHAYQAASSWSESTVTWNNKPSTTGAATSTSSATGWRQWTVTSKVTAMYTGTNNGFLIRDASEGHSTGVEQRFNSRENTTNKPELVITFGPS